MAVTLGPLVVALPVPMVRTPRLRELMVKPAPTVAMAATAGPAAGEAAADVVATVAAADCATAGADSS